MNEPTHLDLFSGIGGFALAAKWAGFRTIGHSEVNPFGSKVLASHWPDTPNFGDVRNIYRYADEYKLCDCCEEPWCDRHDQHYADCECIGPSQWDGEYIYPDLITAGVPCQPASQVGRRRGSDDERWLWDEAIRVTGVLRPQFAVFENPIGILSVERGEGFKGVLRALAEIGYDCWWDVLSASAIGFGHRRERVFLVATNTERTRLEGHSGHDGDTGLNREGTPRPDSTKNLWAHARPKYETEFWYETESPVCPVVDGIPAELLRQQLSAVGNSVVPQVAYEILKGIRTQIT